jgi:hypothetical protein
MAQVHSTAVEAYADIKLFFFLSQPASAVMAMT